MNFGVTMSLRISLSLMLLGALSAAATALGTHLGAVPQMSLNLWYSILFLAGVSYAKYVYANFQDLDAVCAQNVSMTDCRTASFESKSEFVEKLGQLVIGAKQVCVFNLSNPAGTDKEIVRYLKRLHAYLSSRTAESQLRYRRISSVGSRRDVRWTFQALRRFARAKPLEHVCLERSAGLYRHLSYILVEREAGYYAFLFSMLKGGGRMNVVMIRNEDVGRFVLDEFERVWTAVERRQEPILRHGQIHFGQVDRLAARYGCTDSEEYKCLLGYRKWRAFSDQPSFRRFLRLLGFGP